MLGVPTRSQWCCVTSSSQPLSLKKFPIVFAFVQWRMGLGFMVFVELIRLWLMLVNLVENSKWEFEQPVSGYSSSR